MKTVFVGLASAMLLLGGSASGAEPLDGESTDSQDLIFLAPKHPLFIRLHIKVNGRGYRELPDVLAENLFKALDLDEDGLLNAQEAERIPPRNRFRDAAQATPVKYDEIDLNTNQQIEPQELQSFVRQSVGNPLSLQRGTGRPRVDVDLFARFDINHDGQVTDEEIQQLRQRLAKQDIDDDETLSALEFAPLMPLPGSGECGGDVIDRAGQ